MLRESGILTITMSSTSSISGMPASLLGKEGGRERKREGEEETETKKTKTGDRQKEREKRGREKHEIRRSIKLYIKR